MNNIPYVPMVVQPIEETSALSSLQDDFRSRAESEGVAGPIIDQILPELIPVIVNMLRGCFNRDVTDEQVERALTSDARRAGAFRARAVRRAASKKGPRLTRNQQEACCRALDQTARANPAAIASLVREDTSSTPSTTV